ncbi:hypothetical protein LQF12_12065 [Ruania suaedae]|uniref:hypothetical protein n=1 Tax=Ruania suaedae TaxID=2897774 RepID=UPI001E62CD93|nr:hypothetical protein [Ruania suaedae]UFU02239.1 hypothetical protein LQF12_12065 [Ruania suaedae]
MTCEAAIWIGIESRDPGDEQSATPVAAERIAVFVDETFPGTRVGGRGPASFFLRYTGSLSQVMHVADELGWHVRCLSEAGDVPAFAARIGVVIAEGDESVASLLHRAEEEAREVGAPR